MPSSLSDATDASIADAATPAAASSASPTRRADIVDSYDESLLFADEVAHLQEVSRELVAAQHVAPVQVLSRQEHEELAALVASGRLRKGGPVCAIAPSKTRVGNANVGGLGIVVRFACSETATCDVRAELVDGVGPPSNFAYLPELDNWGAIVRAKGDVPSGGDVAAIERALRAAPVEAFSWAKRTPPARAPLVRRPGHRAITVRIAGGWPAPPKASDFASVQPAIDACGGTKSFPKSVVVAVGPSGAVARCEPSDGGSDPLALCACRVLAKQSFGAGAAGRRLLLEVERAVAKGTLPTAVSTPGPRATPEISAAPPEASLTNDWEFSDSLGSAFEPLAVCFHPLAARRDDDTTVALDLDEAGFVKSATLNDTAWMTDAQRTCAQKAATTLKFQCPLADVQRHLKITVSVGR